MNAPVDQHLSNAASPRPLPPGWRWVRLGDVCEVQNGFAFDSARFSGTEGIPLIRIRDLKTNLPSEKYSGDFDREYLVEPGDLLVGMDGEFGCYRWDGPTALLNQRVCRLLPRPSELTAEFLRLALNDYLKEIERETSFTTVKHISSRQILGVRFALPSVKEQKRIGAALTEQMAAVERARVAAEAQLEAAKVLPDAYLRHAFHGMTPLSVGDRRAVPPRNWTWRPLTSCARLESGHTPSRYHPEWWGGQTPWISLTDIRELDGKIARQTREYTNEEGIANSAARVLPAGTVVLSRTASVGFVTIMGREMATSQDFVNWVCGPDLEPRFLAYLLRASRSYLRSLSSGAIHQTIYMPTVEAFEVCIPDLKEQQRIAGALDEQMAVADRARGAAASQLSEISALPAALLRRAFSGEL